MRESNLARTSWIGVVVICIVAVPLLLFNGYTGYGVVVAAVGAAAAVNLT